MTGDVIYRIGKAKYVAIRPDVSAISLHDMLADQKVELGVEEVRALGEALKAFGEGDGAMENATWK